MEHQRPTLTRPHIAQHPIEQSAFGTAVDQLHNPQIIAPSPRFSIGAIDARAQYLTPQARELVAPLRIHERIPENLATTHGWLIMRASKMPWWLSLRNSPPVVMNCAPGLCTHASTEWRYSPCVAVGKDGKARQFVTRYGDGAGYSVDDRRAAGMEFGCRIRVCFGDSVCRAAPRASFHSLAKLPVGERFSLSF